MLLCINQHNELVIRSLYVCVALIIVYLSLFFIIKLHSEQPKI